MEGNFPVPWVARAFASAKMGFCPTRGSIADSSAGHKAENVGMWKCGSASCRLLVRVGDRAQAEAAQGGVFRVPDIWRHVVHFHRSSSIVRCSATASDILSASSSERTPQNLRTGFPDLCARRSADAILARYSSTSAVIVVPLRVAYVWALRAQGIKAIKVVAADGSKANGEESAGGRASTRAALWGAAILAAIALVAAVVGRSPRDRRRRSATTRRQQSRQQRPPPRWRRSQLGGVCRSPPRSPCCHRRRLP